MSRATTQTALNHALPLLFGLEPHQRPGNPLLQYRGAQGKLMVNLEPTEILSSLVDTQHQPHVVNAPEVSSYLHQLTQLPQSGYRYPHQITVHLGEPVWATVPLLRYYQTDTRGNLALSILATFFPWEGPCNSQQLRQELGLPEDSDAEERYLDSLPPEERDTVDRRFWEGTQKLPIRLREGEYISQEAWIRHPAFLRHFFPDHQKGILSLLVSDIQQWINDYARA